MSSKTGTLIKPATSKPQKSKGAAGPWQGSDIVVAEKSVLGDDEDVEKLHALSSPIKPAPSRITNLNAVHIEDHNTGSDGDEGKAGGSVFQVRPKPALKAQPRLDENPDILFNATPALKTARTTSNMDVEIFDRTEELAAKTRKRKRVEKMDDNSDDEPKLKVKVERDDDEDLNGEESGRRNKITVKALPPAAQKHDRWRRRFMPTIVRFIGAVDNPWNVDEDVFRDALERIWDVVYKTTGIEYTDGLHVIVRALTIQRLDEWRSSFGSTAIAALELFFKSDSKYQKPEYRVKFSRCLLELRRFAYEDAKGSDPEEFKGLFRSLLILRIFATHLSAIEGAIDVEGLYPEPSPSDDGHKILSPDRPIGALGLAGAAVECGLILWKYLAVTYKGSASTQPARVRKFEGGIGR
ncbi:hypothetical protein SCP_0603910 [Sparassis crispa]|uniref:Uncharacterized protein n=1 Tax=Sparassis crispa TaxID=139825 RepID=A0A401GQC8_9APHY|nr:hypothetical protein SCP_0603910 [Sparassis crispa]GBE84412.1 hypothetical protein SCP_0603910 [Sparassis crispa]